MQHVSVEFPFGLKSRRVHWVPPLEDSKARLLSLASTIYFGTEIFPLISAPLE